MGAWVGSRVFTELWRVFSVWQEASAGGDLQVPSFSFELFSLSLVVFDTYVTNLGGIPFVYFFCCPLFF